MIRYAIDLVRSLAARFHLDERGQDIMEYALLGGFIAVGFAIAAAILTPAVWTNMVNVIAECVDFDTTCP